MLLNLDAASSTGTRGPHLDGQGVKSIDDVCLRVTSGGTPSRRNPSFYEGGNWPWIKTQELLDGWLDDSEEHITDHAIASSSARLLPENTVLMAMYGATVSKLGILRRPMTCNQACCAMIVDPTQADVRYLFYLLLHARPRIKSLATGAAQQNLSGRLIKSLKFPFPSLPEQRAIAHILGTLDDKIELNRRMNQILEEMARALFKSWFVDFDPVRAKAALKQHVLGHHAAPETELRSNGATPSGEWTVARARAHLDAVDPQIVDLFPDRLVPSELGEIPEGWEIRTLGDLSQKPQYGYTESAKDEPIGPKFLRITDINKEAWIEWESVPHCEIVEEDFKKYRLSEGDILVARMADPGHGCMIEDKHEAVFASYLIRFRPKQKCYARFLQYWLHSDGYWELVKGRAAGTTRVSLNARVLSGFPMLLPTDALLGIFGEVINSLRSHVIANTYESRMLAAQRDAVLPRLVLGEVGVGESKSHVSGTV